MNDFPLYNIGIDYTYLNSDKKTETYQSEYILDFLRNQLILNIDNFWWLGIRQSWLLRYEDRVNFEDNFIVDTQLSKEIGYFNLFIKVTNLFNKSYQQISGVPLPGRWIITGLKFKIG